jgi:IclR family pca regulon transcriptional regulator
MIDATSEDEAKRRTETMGGLAKGLAIIEMFGAGHDRLTLADAARGTDITRAAARRCLLTLVDLGYVSFDGKFFHPLPRLRRLGGRAIDSGSLADRAQPILIDACEQLNESISLAVLDGRESLFVARAESAHIVSTGVQLGGRLPAYCSATGRLLLSGLEDAQIRQYLASTPLIPRTPLTLVDPDAIFARIVETRESGVSFSDEELELGMRALAVAVRNASGDIIAAMSLSTSSARVSLEQMKTRYLPVLKKHVVQLESRLG